MCLIPNDTMQKQLTPIQVAEAIRQKFSVSTPVFFAADTESIKIELKPYLQPFERELAMRELRALLNTGDLINEEHGYRLVRTIKTEIFFRERLTYWQRVGRLYLEPSVQTALEFTQNGLTSIQGKNGLHNARRLRYGPHDLHEYRGKFFPQLVRSLINISGIADGDLVLDPMSGSGTTPCEALASGRSTIGADLNPLSVLISLVKAGVVLEDPSFFFKTVSGYLKRFKYKSASPNDIWTEVDLTYLSRWFDAAAVRDLAAILGEIKIIREPFYYDFFRVCLSNIIRSISWQKDTDLRVRKEIKSYEPGTAIVQFNDEVKKQIEKIYPYLCVLPQPGAALKLTIRQGNAVNVVGLFPEYRGKANLLITSPPYATALPYLDTDRLSLIVLGLLPRQQHRDAETIMVGTREISERQRREVWERYLGRKHELPKKVASLITQIAEYNHGDHVGFRRRNLPALLGKYFIDMFDAMRSAHALMAAGAHGYYVVGNNSTIVNGQKIEIPTDKFLFEIGKAAGWKQDEMIPMELLISRDIFKENRGSSETILCFSA